MRWLYLRARRERFVGFRMGHVVASLLVEVVVGVLEWSSEVRVGLGLVTKISRGIPPISLWGDFLGRCDPSPNSLGHSDVWGEEAAVVWAEAEERDLTFIIFARRSSWIERR